MRLQPSPRWPVRPRVERIFAPHKEEDATRGSIERMRVTGNESDVELLSITRRHIDQVGDLHSLWCDLSVPVRSRMRLIGLSYVLQSWRANTSFRMSCVNNYWRDVFSVQRGLFSDVLTLSSTVSRGCRRRHPSRPETGRARCFTALGAGYQKFRCDESCHETKYHTQFLLVQVQTIARLYLD